MLRPEVARKPAIGGYAKPVSDAPGSQHERPNKPHVRPGLSVALSGFLEDKSDVAGVEGGKDGGLAFADIGVEVEKHCNDFAI